MELEVKSMDCITPISDDSPPPPLVVASLNLKTYMNKETRNNEIVAACAIVYNHGKAHTTVTAQVTFLQ